MAREMKDSGVAWIGEIPADWILKRIKFLRNGEPNSFIDGDWIESPYITDFGIRYLTTGNIGDGIFKRQGNSYITNETFKELNCKFAYPGDIVISRLNAPYGRACILPLDEEKYVLAVDIVILRTDENKSFLCYLMQCEGYQNVVQDGTKGTTMKRISRTNLGNVILPIPPCTVQNVIADLLNKKCAEIDAVLEKTRASIEEYKKLKQAIITQAVTKGVRGDRPMKESGMEWVKEFPIEWTTIPSKYLFGNSDERKRPNDELLTASQKHGVISQTDYMEKENTRIVLATKDIENWKHVEPYDFIISLRSFQGGLEMSEISGCITWHYIVLKPLKTIHSFYYKWLFKSELYVKALQRTCNFIRDGQDLRYSNFVQVPLLIPPLDEQKEIADKLNARCAEIDALIQKKQKLLLEMESYRKSLIYEYVTGKKKAPPAQFQATIAFVDTRALLLCRIIELLKPKGRIHLMKALFTVDCLLDLNSVTQYQRQKHGPYDMRIEEYEQVMERNGWVSIKKGSPVNYILSHEFEMYRKPYQTYFGKVDEQIQRICAFLRPMKTSKAERVATLLAAWNDFIMDGIAPTDQQIVQEVRSNWTPNKAHSSEATWLGTLSEMKEHQIIPFGHGKHTIHM